MRWWPFWSRVHPMLSMSQQERLAVLLARQPRLDAAWGAQRMVIVDVETSGLDPRRDRLIAIGGVSCIGTVLDPSDSFETVLRQAAVSSDENILIHGISGGEQRGGREPAEALISFLDYASGAVLIGYHARFDRTVLERSIATHLGLRWRAPWLDLAYLGAALRPTVADRPVPLDTWLAHFGLAGFSRHHAVSDALATAELWLALQATLPAACGSTAALLRIAHSQRRLLHWKAGR